MLTSGNKTSTTISCNPKYFFSQDIGKFRLFSVDKTYRVVNIPCLVVHLCQHACADIKNSGSKTRISARKYILSQGL